MKDEREGKGMRLKDEKEKRNNERNEGRKG